MSRDISQPEQGIPIGRRVFLGIAGLGILGIVFGSKVQSAVGETIGTGIGGLLPGGDRFRIYSITGSFPNIGSTDYRLTVSGLVDHPMTLTLDDLKSMPSVHLVKDFQCVTGWRVPQVHWEGVKLSDVIDAAGARSQAGGVEFSSFDGADTESLTLSQARRSDVIVAYRMLGGPISSSHGGPVRLYVAPMYGYKSLKWLSGIRLVEKPVPGYWEQNGYPVDAWVGNFDGRQDAPIT
ncbi:MAG: oxidoreductase [Actinomycetota bacterium]|nr:MAG: oxidoreductase [Actinomycetota bacterium]